MTSVTVRKTFRSGSKTIRAAWLIVATAVGWLAMADRPAFAANAVTFWNETAITTSAVHLGRASAVSVIDLAYVHAAIY